MGTFDRFRTFRHRTACQIYEKFTLIICVDHGPGDECQMKRLCQFRKDEDGATAIEYGVLAMVFVIGLALLHQSRDNASRVLDGFTAINRA